LTTRPRLRNWKPSLARNSTEDLTNALKPKGTPDEDLHAKNHIVDRTRCAAVWRGVMRKKSRIRETEQCRLLHLHDAPLGEIAGSEREMSHLRNGSGAGDEEKR